MLSGTGFRPHTRGPGLRSPRRPWSSLLLVPLLAAGVSPLGLRLTSSTTLQPAAVRPATTTATSSRTSATGTTATTTTAAATGTTATSSRTTGTPGGTNPAAPAPPSSVTFDRVAGTDRYATAVAISQRLIPPGSVPSGGTPIVYLASGTVFADAAAAGPVAAHGHGVVLLTPRDTLPSVVAAELARLEPQRLVIVGGPVAVSAAVMAQAGTAAGVTPQRIYGSDRAGTAAALSADAFSTAAPGTVTAYLATGRDFPDALTIGPAAGHSGGPLLLASRDRLPAATVAEIRRLRPAQVVVIGGSNAISSATLNAVHALGPPVIRVFGANRYATAAAIAAHFFPADPAAFLATGLTFPDALAGGPYAAAQDAPILLDVPDLTPTLTETRNAVLAARPDHLVALGGQNAMRDAVLNELAAWSEGHLSVPPAGPTYPSYDAVYHDYQEVELTIKATAAAYPDLVSVFSIGKSYQGRDIWAAKVTSPVGGTTAKPEALIDGLHHSLEHLALEQTLYLLHVLTHDYSTDATVKRLVDTRVTYIIFAVNPDGLAYDLTGSPFRHWRKNRQPNSGSSAVGTDINRNYGTHWGCCGGSSSNPAAWNYRGAAPWSTPEARAVRDFVLSQVVNGVQQIKTHITFHTDGELILWPYGYTKTDIPKDMTTVDHQVFVAMGKAMAKTNGYKPEQSSDLYVTDGDEIDWMYGAEHIFSFTFEMYPDASAYAAPVYSPASVVARETARNRAAMLYLIDMAACPYAAIGKAATYCSNP